MKNKLLTRIIAAVLIVCMLPVNAFAAGGRSSRGSWGSWGDWWSNWWGNSSSTEETESTESTESSGEAQLLLVEDATTVENADALRASTYVLTTSDEVAADINAASEEGTTYDVSLLANEDDSVVLKYFPITMYDYDADTINAATFEADLAEDPDLTAWQGIYFSAGSPTVSSSGNTVSEYTPDTSSGSVVIEDGTYYIYSSANSCYMTASTTSNGNWNNATFIQGNVNQSSAALLTITAVDGGYTIQNSSDNYLDIPSNNNANFQTASNVVSFEYSNSTLYLKDNDSGLYLNALGGAGYSAFGGWSDGSPLTLYKVTTASGATSYAAWNHWNKYTSDNANGQKTYTGLVESTLDANKDIVFTKPDGGIFNSDATVKTIYTNVEMPFVYSNGTYTFDASVNGVYFHEDETQGSSGTAASNTRLYFNEGVTQSNGGTYGDGSSTVWAPFNDSTSFSENTMNYHFGMRATIPFSMTTNGRMNENLDTSEPIQFSFSGDDDVWVFIDGQLVIDLGGIHNRLDATINFAENTITYSVDNDAKYDTDDDGVADTMCPTGSYNDEDFALVQTLFTTSEETGVISQDRTTFAATDSHELTIFYLERGQGSSNCKIEFNLPMKDTVTVTKHATQSWTDDGSEEGVVTNLTAAEQAIVDNIDFGFTLYKSTDGGSTFSVVANTNYSLLNANGQVISVPSTDANGHFTLKNGQSARFVTTFTDAGVTYYVVEDDVSSLGFVTPDYNFGGESANGFSVDGTSYDEGNKIPEQILEVNAESNKSHEVTVYGGDEYEDSVVFICENYLDAKLPNPSARPAEDRIVIDYGLGVVIDVLSNDLYRGDSIELVSVTGSGVVVNAETGAVTTAGANPVYGTATISDGKINYQLTSQLSGVEVLNYVVKVTGTAENETVGTTNTAYEYAVGTVYIIPATTMYYEENFSDMVTYTGSRWQSDLVTESQYTNTTQEPGVVGTVGDSPYGSDAAYLNDSHDSNGTSKYANTSDSAVKFSYTFTGTGSSFYARTTNNSGFMRVTVTDSSGATVQDIYRDTVYITDDDDTTLYNIPVYTIEALEHGTYTVTVLVYKGTETNKYGTDFWLDGIRVYQPLDPALVYPDENTTQPVNYAVAASAYATDGEANMANETLRNKLISDANLDADGNPVWTEDGNFVLFTDVDGAMDTAEEYESIGPKEEVYLNDGQSVTFSLTDWDSNTNKIYLGIKAPTGSGTVNIGGTTLTINNAADCYYDISSYATITTDADGIKTATFTITAGSGSLISVTNIKVSGNFEFTIIEGENING